MAGNRHGVCFERIRSVNATEWEKFNHENGGTFRQSAQWLLPADLEWQAWGATQYAENGVRVAQLGFRIVPGIKTFWGHRVVLPFRAIEWARGPVLSPLATTDHLAVLLESIRGFSARRSVASIGPFTLSDWQKDVPTCVPALLKTGFSRDTWATYLVDLEVSDQTLWARLAHSAKYSIKKCQREGVRIHFCETWDDVREQFLPELINQKARAGIKVSTRLYESLMSDTAPPAIRSAVAIDSQNRVLGVLGSYFYRDTATIAGSAIHPDSKARSLPVQDALYWSMLVRAQGEGIKRFDLAGVAPNSSELMAGIKFFKSKWGGEYVEYDQFSGVTGLGRLVNRFRRPSL